MKYALKKWWNYLIGLLGYALVSCIAVLPRIILLKDNTLTYKFPKEWVAYVFVFCAVVLALIGFIIQDVYRARIRSIIHDWDNDLPDENINKAWMIFLPFLIAAIPSFLTGLIFLIPSIQF